MIRDVKSKLPDNAATTRTMNYILEKAELVGGSEAKFENTSMEEYAEFGAKKFRQVNNKYQSKTGRSQEIEAIHEIISFHTDDKVSPEMARDLALTVWRNVLDLDNRKYRWAVHTDTDEIHVHLVWNKRDNKGNLYNQHNDYAFFEKACQEIEEEYGLKVVENRKSLNPQMLTSPKPSNEYRLENRGIKSEKSKFKEAVHAAADKAMTAGEFLEFLDRDGYTLIVNGSQGYSLEKEGQIFKASEVGASYKLLKARFGDDPQFSDTLARLGVKKAPEREMGGISFDMYVTQADLDQYEAKKKKSNRVLDTRFDSRNGHDFFFKDTNKKAFKYDAMRGRVDFNNNSPTAVKAGLQKLTENVKKPTAFKIGGSDYAKREIWLQFHLMGLDKKGHTISGYSPTQADKFKLEQEKQKFGSSSYKQDGSNPLSNKAKDPDDQNKAKSGAAAVVGELVDAGKLHDEFKNGKVTGSGPVGGVIAGIVNAMTDLSNSFSANSIEDKFSEMRVLEKGIKDKNEEAESQRHEQKKQNRRNRNIPRPQ
ncbi:relaxase/mobilization nuclease domain-containing protein [Pseudomonas aeruginosa]|nr:relaxase/mobilization nuclease domain-containing protein [Pseudomonas aeruginosa]MDI3701388.1 relaxase/mobilization nuclease domain-containing protein [Pseudomonas aeruginosa]MDI3901572.1 relaxase/mobilization nuclease domain-containing protein [Pseudomonas aeruginosa]